MSNVPHSLKGYLLFDQAMHCVAVVEANQQLQMPQTNKNSPTQAL